MTIKVVVGTLAAVALAVSAAPAFADGEGTVSARVTVADACITVSPGSLDFGVQGFSQSNVQITAASQPVTVANCSPGPQNIAVRGTNATSSGGTSWSLVGDQDALAAPNNFMQRIDNGTISMALTTQDQLFMSLGGNIDFGLTAHMVMPVLGSDGAGEAMGFSYVFTAVLA